MGVASKEFSEYRTSFADFARKVKQARALMAAKNPDWQAIDGALLELEKARVNYNQCRDVLAQKLLSFPLRTVPDSTSRVSEIAELRWQLAGKPEGTDEENWYRAEEIVRRATAA